MRLAVYEDAIYHRDADGTMSVHRAFPLFMCSLAEEMDHLVVLGRLSPGPERSHYVLPQTVEFVALPWYRSLAEPGAVARAALGTVARFWQVLGRVDGIWVNGPQPIAIGVVMLALTRRRRVFLGVRQNTIEYARTRHPRNRKARWALQAMELAWRALARVAPVVAVGPELAGLYTGARRVHELSVSFVAERDLLAVTPERDWAGELRALSVGRLETEKNPLLMADILAALEPRWRLLIVGEGPLEAALRARLEELGVADRAELLGYVPLDRGLFELYRSSHAFLHVSWTEGLPQVLLEAFAARVPVVATEVGGVGPIARGAALLVPPGDARAAAHALTRLQEEEPLREVLAAAGSARVAERTAEAQRRNLAAFFTASG